jgi:hypothetical protein
MLTVGSRGGRGADRRAARRSDAGQAHARLRQSALDPQA